MIRSLILVPLLSLGLAVAAPAQQTSTATDQQGLRQQIFEFGKKYDEAVNKHDVSAVLALFTQDAVIMPEGTMLSGRQAIEKAYEDLFRNQRPTNHANQVMQDQTIGNNAAWAVGEWSATFHGPDNKTQDVHGNWGNVLVREGGQWKIRMLTWNSIEAPATATGSTAPPTSR